MPRGFLVKRQKHSVAYSYRVRSDEERSDSGSEREETVVPFTNLGSPDSGYSQSPVSLTFRDDREAALDSLGSTPSSSPLSVNTTAVYHSPFYFAAFDRLSVSSPQHSKLHQHHQHLLHQQQQQQVQKTVQIENQPPKTTQNTFQVTVPAVGLPQNLSSPNKKRGSDGKQQQKSIKKPKAARKITFDEDKSSPVSGTIIRDFSDSEDDGAHVVGDIDAAFNFVEVTPEAKAELEKIENRIGDYVCQLCKEHYDDAFQLAQHRCSRIIHVEYRCPECDKVFSCPANLASHRRWHKPRPAASNSQKSTGPAKILPASSSSTSTVSSVSMTQVGSNNNKIHVPNVPRAPSGDGEMIHDAESDIDSERLTPSPAGSNGSEEGQFECSVCGKRFRKQAYLRKHKASHNEDRPFSCHLCGKSFRTDASRAKHVLHHALGPKEHRCEVCGNTYPTRGALERHSRVHNTEVYTCKYCSSTFYSSPGLTRHINKCHPSENRQVILLQLPVQRTC